MPFEDWELPLRDILDAVNAIEDFTRGLTLESFERDAKTEAAVERKLQVVSEAAIRLGENAEAICRACPGATFAESGIGCDMSIIASIL